MAKLESTVLDHLEWLGYVQPTGLVVSAHMLVTAGAILDRHDIRGQKLLQDATIGRPVPGSETEPYIADFAAFAHSVLGWSWSPRGFVGMAGTPIPAELTFHLSDYDETLAPTYAVSEANAGDDESKWQLLVQVIEPEQDLDAVLLNKYLEISPHSRMERLLRHTGVPAGLITNGRVLRLISAPQGESSGWLDFRVPDMTRTAGRPICSAMRLLLGQARLLALPKEKRLAALLNDSRKHQNVVSNRLSEQVLHALYELLRGLQAAHDASRGQLLREVLASDPNSVYRALLTVLLRLVFLLYTEERGMLPQNEAFLRHYSLTGLHERLRAEAALYPDTMEQRFGAWAQLLVLFRMMYDGADTTGLDLPPRHGDLFDPDRFPFLEGRSSADTDAQSVVPFLPDGTVQRALESLLVLDGERLSYRALDVEQIGSIYEAMMGFQLVTTTGRSVAIRAQARNGAPTVIDLDALQNEEPKDRKKWLTERLDRKITPRVLSEVADATSVTDLHAALQGVIDLRATPDLVPTGALVLQPSDERRRSGSHYTPRELTEPIVRKALEPILKRLAGDDTRGPTPKALLDLKVCDPAMGSGAFLVEACRQLGDVLVTAWRSHDQSLTLPADEDATIFARRLVAQRCLYGVDRNPVAVDLAKVSLWLVTLAKAHPLTFLDHALRHGDSLVGLSKKQLQAFHWEEVVNNLAGLEVDEQLERSRELRKSIRNADDSTTDEQVREWWSEANRALEQVRVLGDLVVLAHFEGNNRRSRLEKREEYAAAVIAGTTERFENNLAGCRKSERPVVPFHWEVEFPEVFERENRGFDVFVGNPPFAGKNNVIASNPENYLSWLIASQPESHGNSDLVAHFFRCSFNLLRQGGTLGFIATNTIGQGDTRSTGLRWICGHGGEIYSARRRIKWPGAAAVVVSVVHVSRGDPDVPRVLDGRRVDQITAFLFHAGGSEDPERMTANAKKSFVGAIVLGMGFTFDDSNPGGVASPIAKMTRLLNENSDNGDVIFPYVGGEEVNTSPTHAHHRYVINFGDRSEAECRQQWPELMAIVEAKVKPERMKLNDNPDGRRRKQHWWQFGRSTPALIAAVEKLERVVVTARTSTFVCFTWLPAGMVYSENLVVFPLSVDGALAVLQSRVHDVWVRFTTSTLKDDIGYRPSDCFETFAFPENWQTRADFEMVGKDYYDFRANLMIDNDEGLTKTYNRFHDPNESDPDIVRLRELHTAMDRVVLDAYGWTDISTVCEFLLDYEIGEDEWGNRRKPYRYRWPDDVRDEVLGRLLALNTERAKAEGKLHGTNPPRTSMTEPRGRAASDQGGLFK